MPECRSTGHSNRRTFFDDDTRPKPNLGLRLSNSSLRSAMNVVCHNKQLALPVRRLQDAQQHGIAAMAVETRILS